MARLQIGKPFGRSDRHAGQRCACTRTALRQGCWRTSDRQGLVMVKRPEGRAPLARSRRPRGNSSGSPRHSEFNEAIENAQPDGNCHVAAVHRAAVRGDTNATGLGIDLAPRLSYDTANFN